MRRSSAITLQDVAREAGVATMTASVVLNGGRSGTRVSEATRVRIQEVAARMRYRANGAARGLSRRRMDTLGVVSIIDSDEVNVYFLEVLNGILGASSRRGQNTSIFSIADWQRDEQKILQFCDGRVDGIIFIGPMFTADFAQTVLHYAPFVALHSNGVMPHTYNLDVDNEAGAHQAVQYLIAQGHRRIAHFSGGDRFGSHQRVAGYRRALAEAGIACDESLVVAGHFNNASGQERMNALLDQGKALPTALFCANDSIAVGCMEVLSARGLRVPEDISIVGFDDLIVSRMTMPQLTTVRQPLRHMGHRAVDLLLLQIYYDTEATHILKSSPPPSISTESFPLTAPADAAEAVTYTELFETELVLRGSVGSPPANPVFYNRP